MLAVFLILLATAAIVMLEVPSLVKHKRKKELWAFSMLLLFGSALSIALSLNADIPNPVDWISALYRPFSNMLEMAFK
ncbi:hypothetical protein [Paenibacillus spongiae]|uniref:Uncharacterized protein n=1 Tax=Paenibacillus spongiae TaxID=2909671 RepID=A0ABY5S6W5_9BACL|nr:hypothetical protein [Paenibacillus spongiae]UVI28587.1 hypothetical protein L1F29_24515 [Paenibacillus spongiae]